MKEATGELNMTVVTIVAIAALLAFFYAVIWPSIQRGMALNSACSASNGQGYITRGTNSCISCAGGNPNTCSYYTGDASSGGYCSGTLVAAKTCNSHTEVTS